MSDPQINLNRFGCVKKNDRNEINSGGSPRLTIHLGNHLLTISGYPFGIASGLIFQDDYARLHNYDSIIALRFQPIRSRGSRWLFLNNHLLKMNNHLPLQFTPRISVSWMVCRTMTCICFGSVYKPSNRFSIANRKTKIEKRFVIRFFIFQFKNKNEL